jgi:glycosyltransferase involved in cell wall biosynthesis
MTEEIRPFLSRFSSPAIFLRGTFPEFELHEQSSQGSVFCPASVEEGLAMVQPMAMTCGLPVVCTTNTRGEDIVRDGQDGFVIPIQGVSALKEKILYFYENRDACVEMGRSTMERVRTGFVWSDHTNKY